MSEDALEQNLREKELAYSLLKKELERVKRAWSAEANRRIRIQQAADRIKIRYDTLMGLARAVCKWTLREQSKGIQYSMEELSRFIEAVDGPVEWYT